MRAATTQPREDPRSGAAAVVIRCGERIVKGHLEWPPWSASGDGAGNAPEQAQAVFRIRHLESNTIEEIAAGAINAVFFVNDFQGDPDRDTVRFHASETALPGIWIQAQLPTGEVVEGIVENSLRYLVDPGFFLRPTDPGSNNKLVYVMKSALVAHHVLGVTRV